ncbi:hypothetical protein [Cryptosporangium minutisporangium]|uniref:DUF1707 domain-containing protein n=1 Tax=Cryptosporangium minutisporangium TaxID=113569 RepID=A0ABP6T3S2_9ACTN
MADTRQDTARDELALPEYDRLTPDDLRTQLEPLTAAQVERMHAHAVEGGASTEIVEVLADRLDGLRQALRGSSDDTPAPFAHHGAGAATGGVSPQTTTAPPINPPSHGDPTNPAQPRG